VNGVNRYYVVYTRGGERDGAGVHVDDDDRIEFEFVRRAVLYGELKKKTKRRGKSIAVASCFRFGPSSPNSSRRRRIVSDDRLYSCTTRPRR